METSIILNIVLGLAFLLTLKAALYRPRPHVVYMRVEDSQKSGVSGFLLFLIILIVLALFFSWLLGQVNFAPTTTLN